MTVKRVLKLVKRVNCLRLCAVLDLVGLASLWVLQIIGVNRSILVPSW